MVSNLIATRNVRSPLDVTARSIAQGRLTGLRASAKATPVTRWIFVMRYVKLETSMPLPVIQASKKTIVRWTEFQVSSKSYAWFQANLGMSFANDLHGMYVDVLGILFDCPSTLYTKEK